MKKMMIIAVLIFCVLSSQMEIVAPQVDCYDACSTGCVQSNTRLMQRCDRKCQIRCSPGTVYLRLKYAMSP
ncbi:Tubby-like F-box protein 8 [Gossypium australe]|uniref:Tubby-like F-box protein 8 n=1 Tax=Gossypium australe TaxID=47621 RepID=A0A5B6V2P0_9ROSI|nr:Tubby-like F-box protein 8 [Gossypium australe]